MLVQGPAQLGRCGAAKDSRSRRSSSSPSKRSSRAGVDTADTTVRPASRTSKPKISSASTTSSRGRALHCCAMNRTKAITAAHASARAIQRAPGKKRMAGRSPQAAMARSSIGANIIAHQCDFFAQIEARAQLPYSLLAGADVGRIAGRKQPSGQHAFPGGGARGREQFGQRSAAEQVEIFGVDVISIAKRVALPASSDPPVFDPGERAIVVRYGAESACAQLIDAIVHHRERDEDNQGQHSSHQGEIHPAPMDTAAITQRDDAGDEPRVSDLAKAAISGGLRVAPVFQARTIFIPGRLQRVPHCSWQTV